MDRAPNSGDPPILKVFLPPEIGPLLMYIYSMGKGCPISNKTAIFLHIVENAASILTNLVIIKNHVSSLANSVSGLDLILFWRVRFIFLLVNRVRFTEKSHILT